MRSENQTKLNKIRRVSVVLRVLCKGLLGLIACIGVASIVCVTFGVGGIDFDGIVLKTGGLGVGHRLALGLVTGVAWAILFKCLFHLHLLFGNYSRGEIFTRYSVGQMRKFGIACVLWCVANFLWLLSLALSMRSATTFSANAGAFVVGAVIIAIAWFMEMAVEMREENDLTI